MILNTKTWLVFGSWDKVISFPEVDLDKIKELRKLLKGRGKRRTEESSREQKTGDGEVKEERLKDEGRGIILNP